MADLKDLASRYGVLKDKLNAQDFEPNDSVIVSSLMHPQEAARRAKDAFMRSIDTAGGVPREILDESSVFPFGIAPSIDEQAQAGLDLAGLMQTGAIPFAPASAGGTLGTFIGKNARNWDTQTAKLAEEKLNAGADPAEVWREHLIGRMPDKTLFSEISDKDVNLLTPRDIEEKIAYKKILAEGMKAGIKERNASLKVQPDLFAKDIKAYNKQKKADADSMLNEINRDFGLQDYLPVYEGVEAGKGTFSKNVYTHPELFENYPKLGESVTRFGGQSDRFHGSFTPSMSGGNIEIYYPSVEAGTKNSVMAHELQHAIQESERWGRGGNESMIRRNPLDYTSNETIEYAKSLPRYQEMDNDADRKAFIESFARMRLGSPFEAYRRLAGEAQARATEDRLDMDMTQRRENYPLAGGKLSDIPLEDLIYKYASDGPSLAIKAYHGTPHLFDSFDMSKIGTGEGAQAYGHGLYFAQEPSIAESYRKKLSEAEYKTKRGGDLPYGWKSSINEMRRNGQSHEDVVNFLQKIAEQQTHPNWKDAKKLNERIQKGNVVYSDPGNIYETSIQWPNAEREAMDPLGEHHLLDWDQPLSEQSDYVRNKLKKSDFYKNANKAYKDQKQWYLDPSQKTGESFLKYMRSGYDDEFASGIKDAEQYLKNLDIPGLKYLDATSRSTDKGTRNYVMFGDEYPEIIKRAGSLDELQEKYAEGGSVDKDSLQLNKPQRTPNHPDKSHIVKTMVDGKEKIIRFGEQGAETAGKPKEGESDRMTAKRESFKARHAKNIAKGPSSAAYWANKVKWAEGGEVDLSDNQQMKAIPQQPNLARLAELLQNAKSSGNQYSVPDWVPLLGGSGAGDMLLGNAPEEIENWSYGDAPMRVPEMSNVPQFKKGRAQSLADTAMLLSGPAESTARNAMAGNVGMIIKPKGGNWLDAYGKTPSRAAYKFERSVDPELAGYARAGMHLMPHEYNETVPVMAVNDWLQQKLAKYIKNEMGTPEDPVRRIAEEWPAKRDVLISQQKSKIPNLQELAAKYEEMGLPPEVIASRMANAQRETAGIQDKITEIEGYNPLHYTPREVRNLDDIESIKAKRAYEGYPEEGIAKTDLGKLWEHYADENITPIKVKNVSEMNVDKNPWLTKLNDEDKVYITDNMAGTGFDKLADELRKATHPDTDLPDFLRIDPDKLSRVSMPQAVEHVAKINAWREAEKLKEGRNTATVMHKEYPDQGLSWMQMKMPEPTFLEGHYIGEDSRGNPAVLDASGREWSSASTPEEALADYRIAERRDALQAALKFEGDTMGHCVGQYCDEVGRGDSNIYSLRDRRGEPHVTIETSKPANEYLYYKMLIDELPYDENAKLIADVREYNAANPHLGMKESAIHFMKDIYGPPEEKIVQIKGKQNAAPTAKYMPAVHDFVRSKDWSSVGDLQNTLLTDLRQDEKYMHPDLYKMATDKYGRFATDDEMDALRDEFYIKNKDIPLKGFAEGGSVQALHDKYEESDYGYGNRPDKTKKGLGYFGELERPDGTGVMTEYSIGVPINGEEMDVPTLIPTLTPDEIRLILHMQDGEDMPRSIVHKAIDHAHQRLSEGKPIFATEEDLYAHGGIVDVLHNDAIEQIMKAFMDSMEDEPKEDEPAAVSIQITTQSQPLKSGKIPTSIREAKHG